MPELSIIMPVYNVSSYVEDAINSILDQTFKDFELIIIDDASNDLTRDKLYNYNDPRIIIIYNQENKGKTFCINKALEIVKGSYITFMDGDDISLTERYSKQISFLESNKEISIVGCGYEKIDILGNHIFNKIPETNHKNIIKYYSLKNLLFGPMFELTDATIVCRRELFKNYSFPEEIRVADYFEFYLLNMKESIYSNLPEVLYKYRSVGKSIILTNQILALKIKIKFIFRYEKSIYKNVMSILVVISRLLTVLLLNVLYKIKRD